MKKMWFALTVLILMAMLVMPVMAAGQERGVLAQETPGAGSTESPLATPTPLPTVEPTVEGQPGFEAGGDDGKFVFGGIYTLRSGEQLHGDLVVIGGVATLQADTRVAGNIVVIGGATDVAGHVQGDMVLIGGAVRLRSTAVVDGQLVRVGGALNKDAGAQIHGGESGGVIVPPVGPLPFVSVRPRFWGFDLFEQMVTAIGTTIVMALLAVFVFALWRAPVERVSRAITVAPVISWVAGFLTMLVYLVAIPVFVVLTIVSAILIVACGLGLLGFVILGAIWLALVVAGVMGWIAVGQIVGERLLVALGGHNVTPAASAAAGTAVITLLWLGLAPLCGLGWLFFVVLGPLGLGAVVLTRFGTREYTNGHMAPPAPISPVLAPAAPIAPSAPSAPSAPAAPPDSNQATPASPAAPAADLTPPSESPAPASPLDKPVGEL